MTGFTKGEWVENKGDSLSKELVITTIDRFGCHQGPICEMDIHFDGEHGEEQQANAHLIAAAPDMYGLLVDILENHEVDKFIDAEIYDLLKKARGE